MSYLYSCFLLTCKTKVLGESMTGEPNPMRKQKLYTSETILMAKRHPKTSIAASLQSIGLVLWFGLELKWWDDKTVRSSK